MPEDKTPAVAPLWLRLLHKAMLPEAVSPHGWLSDPKHYLRRIGDYCPFSCHLCAEQRAIDGTLHLPRNRKTPGL